MVPLPSRMVWCPFSGISFSPPQSSVRVRLRFFAYCRGFFFLGEDGFSFCKRSRFVVVLSCPLARRATPSSGTPVFQGQGTLSRSHIFYGIEGGYLLCSREPFPVWRKAQPPRRIGAPGPVFQFNAPSRRLWLAALLPAPSQGHGGTVPFKLSRASLSLPLCSRLALARRETVPKEEWQQ